MHVRYFFSRSGDLSLNQLYLRTFAPPKKRNAWRGRMIPVAVTRATRIVGLKELHHTTPHGQIITCHFRLCRFRLCRGRPHISLPLRNRSTMSRTVLSFGPYGAKCSAMSSHVCPSLQYFAIIIVTTWWPHSRPLVIYIADIFKRAVTCEVTRDAEMEPYSGDLKVWSFSQVGQFNYFLFRCVSHQFTDVCMNSYYVCMNS